MIPRHIEKYISSLMKGYPVITITGPRQSGKTTLAKRIFSKKPYLSFENPDTLEEAAVDPRSFLDRYKSGAVFDEVQRFPKLLSYLQQVVDDGPKYCRFILTGSQQFGLRSGITQSLAGRTALIHLLPFSYPEWYSNRKRKPKLEKVLFDGLYPPIHDRKLDPQKWYADYVQTYVERDVRQMLNVRELSTFQLFLKMCAARSGNLVNLSQLGADCGITHNTAKEWISILEASYIIFLMQPHYNNLGKRLVKTAKLFFYDSGLLTWLLGIRSVEQLTAHHYRGTVFETYIVSEMIKQRYNRGEVPACYFWRDRSGNEVDLLIEEGNGIIPVEIKSGRTVASDWFTGLKKYSKLAGNLSKQPELVYGGEQTYIRERCRVKSWRGIGDKI